MRFATDPLRGRKASGSATTKKNRSKNPLRVESLEPRSMLSASLGANAVVQPNLQGVLAPLSSSSSFEVYTPAQIRAAYGFNNVSENGAGQTIAIVDAYGDPTISSDLHAFDQQFGLSDPKLSVVNETGGLTLPATNSSWDMEISLDVEWAHAIAPGANILLVEANSASLSDLLTAVNYARNAAGVSVVSMSWGTSDFSGEATYNSYFTTPAGHTPVTFVASSGDNGAGASWPAIADNVVAVGGTTLNLTASGAYSSESAWSGSGGGYSSNEPEESYLKNVQTSGKQSDPDVAFDADPNTGFYVRDNGNWYAVGGTSAGAPQWSALFALANQGRAAKGEAALSNADASLFSLANSDFHKITSGNNGEYTASGNYNVVTGLGTPVANLVINGLIAATNPSSSGSNSTAAVTAQSVSSAADTGATATGVGATGSDSGGGNAAAVATTNTDTLSTTATLQNSGASAIGLNATNSTAESSAAITTISGTDAASPSIVATATADNQFFSELAQSNLTSQFATDLDALPTAMHSHEAIENLLDALAGSEA